jgi:hypothetical protein
MIALLHHTLMTSPFKAARAIPIAIEKQAA